MLREKPIFVASRPENSIALFRGFVSMGSMGLAEPINFERRVLEPIIFLGNSIESHILTPKLGNFHLQKRLRTHTDTPDEVPVLKRRGIEA